MSLPRLRPRRSLPLAAALGVLLLGAMAPAAAASNGKEFILAISPTEVSAGAGGVTASATFTNPADARQQLGSANLTPPPGFVVTQARIAGAPNPAIRNTTVELRNLSLAPGRSVTVTMAISAPCGSSASPEWTVQAKQANDFRGTGNDIALWRASPETSIVTDVAGSCELAWRTAPADARVGQTITATPYTPTAPPSSVAVYDGNGNVITSATGGVTLSFGLRSGLGSLSGATSSLTSPSGVASFGTLAISAPGTYSLIAEVTSGRFDGLVSAPSPRFQVSTVATQCTSGASCQGTVSTTEAKISLTALAASDSPLLTLSLNAGIDLSDAACGWPAGTGYTNQTSLFEVTSSLREKRLSATVAKRYMNYDPDNGAPRLEMCFGSPVAFYAKDYATGASSLTEASSTFDWDRDGDEDPVHVGLLPNCPVAGHPCITQRKKTSGGDGFIEATIPARLGDPAMRP